MFNRMRDAIEAHLTILFTALAVSHAIQFAYRTVHRQSHQAAAIAAQRHDQHQRRHADLSAGHSPHRLQDLHRPRLQSWVPSEMSKLGFSAPEPTTARKIEAELRENWHRIAAKARRLPGATSSAQGRRRGLANLAVRA